MKPTQRNVRKYSIFALVVLLFAIIQPNNVKSQENSNYSFLVAGHAYGAHAGTNIGLHPPFLKKLSEERDTNLLGLFLTGDIVNTSTTASWNKIEMELETLGLHSFYVMGNHDNNTLGHQIFKQKHGGDYYAFEHGSDLFIVLNSTESDRSISPVQLDFLDNSLKNSVSKRERVFIFFHEVIWNSHEKYKLVRSNSRSRYAQLKNISNFWTEVYPKLAALPEKKFFLFAGDVGGNPDAIAASFDIWGNVTLISSGMGEVKDENYMKVNVTTDTVTFQLIPLNDEVAMNSATRYNIPEKPKMMAGSGAVLPPQTGLKYTVYQVSNATGYRWNLPSGVLGVSSSATIFLDFDGQFSGGEISVRAINDGFGESEPAKLTISGKTTLSGENENGLKISIIQSQGFIRIGFNSSETKQAQFRIFDLAGRVVFDEILQPEPGFNTKIISKNKLRKGIFLAELQAENRRITQKIIVF